VHVRIKARTLVSIAGGAAALAGSMSGAFALDYPTRPVHIVLGFPPGGSSDVIGRLIAQWLARDLGQSFVFDKARLVDLGATELTGTPDEAMRRNGQR
jgi:tripartite-type tricarboxylate transporter receptor subunit TctC